MDDIAGDRRLVECDEGGRVVQHGCQHPRAGPAQQGRRSGAGRSQLVELKAVDGDFPFYGTLSLAPDRPLSELLADGGVVDWTQRLLSNAKERLVTSGIGSERVCTAFGPPKMARSDITIIPSWVVCSG